MDKDFMYIVMDHTHGINNQLENMVDEFEKYEEQIIDTMDQFDPIEMFYKARQYAHEEYMTIQRWLLMCKSYVMYNVMYAPKVEKENYHTELMLFASEKFALIAAALSMVVKGEK
jgi:hypothetical protein